MYSLKNMKNFRKLNTPLIDSVENDDISSFRKLIFSGANIEERGPSLRTPFFQACAFNNNKMIDLLLYKGAEINIKDSKGQTPLFIVAWGENFDLVKKLLDLGADPEIKDNKGKTFLDKIKNEKDRKMIEDYIDSSRVQIKPVKV